MRELLLCKAVPPQWGTAYATLLAEGGLRDEGHADITALLTEGGILLGCGSLGGKVIRQVAVSGFWRPCPVGRRVLSAAWCAMRTPSPEGICISSPRHRRSVTICWCSW